MKNLLQRLQATLAAAAAALFLIPTRGAEAPSVPARIAQYPDDAAFPGQGPLRSQMDWFRQLWTERRTQWWRDQGRDQGAVVFLGDSITQGWESLARDFPDLKVANRGISGDLTRGVLYRLQDDVLALNPRAVVLLIGTNDLEDGGTPEVIADNVAAVLTACQRFNPRLPVIVCKVMPSSATMRRPADKIQQINTAVDARLKAFPQAVRVDTWTPFADAAGNAKPAEFPDLLHPNAAGYAKFAEALRPALAKLPPAQ